MKNFKILSGSALKMIAMVTMLVDHFALIILSQLPWATEPFFANLSFYYLCRRVGRLSFPIFCFLLVEGFLHTKNRKKYGVSLAVFALLSEVPFDLMIHGTHFSPSSQNIFFTLLLGFLLCLVLEKVKDPLKLFLCLAGLLAACILVNADYGVRGFFLIGLLYVLRDKKLLSAFFAYPLLSGGFAALTAFVPIGMYNGERGFIKAKWLKYAFYVFYPLHILVILGIRDMII